MRLFLCLLLGYFPGSLNPTALIARIRRVDVRRKGTGNLGATNAMLNFGKAAGAAGVLFDIGKAAGAYLLARRLFPALPLCGLVAGSGAVLGHIFPFYLRFRGGKGFACFGGLVLAFDPELFLLLLGLGIALMIITDHSIALQLSSLVLFPAAGFLETGSAAAAAVCSVVSAVILWRHRSNIADACSGKSPKVREFVRRHFS